MGEKVANYDLKIIQGSDTCDLVFVVTTDDGNPVNLTGYTARLQIRPNVNSDELFDDLSTENDRIILESFVEDGQTFWRVTCKFPHLVTTDYSFLKGVYDLELYKEGKVYRYLEGIVEVNKEVTRQ